MWRSEQATAQPVRHRSFTIAALVAALALGAPGAFAQFTFQFGAGAAWDDNPLNVNGASGSSIITADAAVNYSINAANFGYRGSYVGYDQLSSVDAIIGSAWASYETRRLSVAALFDHRTSIEERLYDYAGVTASAESGWATPGGTRLSLGIEGSVFRFPILTERNKEMIGVSTRINRSFRTRTTIIVGLGATATNYSGDVFADAGASVTQGWASLRLAQSVGNQTGLALQATFRGMGGADAASFTISEDSISYALLDDPSLYSMQRAGVELTHMLMDYSLTLKAGAYLSTRDYKTQGVYTDEFTYDDTADRIDDAASVWASASLHLRRFGPDATITMSAQWSDNSSNSYWYDWSGSYLSLGIQYSF